MYGIFSVSLTNRCNLKCRMCGSQNMDYTPEPKFMTDEVWESLVEKLPGGWGLEINACGEHTLHPKFLDFVESLRKKKGGYSHLKLSTNGMWPWDDMKIKRLIAMMAESSKTGRKSELYFSIDGGCKEDVEWIRRGCDFERILRNVRLSIKESQHAVVVGIAYIAMKRTLDTAISLLETVPGIDAFFLNLLTATTQDMIPESIYDLKEDYLASAELIRQYCIEKNITMNYYIPSEHQKTGLVSGCSFPRYLWIDANGFVYPCCSRWDRPIGNIAELSWGDIVNLGWRKMREGMIAEPQCENCFQIDEAWGWQKHFGSEDWFKKYLAWKAAQEQKP